MQSQRFLLGFITMALGWIAFAPAEANAQHYVTPARVLPNSLTIVQPVVPAMYSFSSYPATFYSSYGYTYAAYPMYPVAYTYVAYTYPTYWGYPSPVYVPTYYAPVYSNYFYPYGYGYYYYRGW